MYAMKDFLHKIFDVQFHYTSINQAAAIWCQRTCIKSQFGCLKILAFSVAIWEIWKWRNKCIHQGLEDPAAIKHKLIYQMQQQNFRINPSSEISWMEEIALTSILIPRKRVKVRHGTWVKWIPNEVGITVNVYGKAHVGSAVFRDSKGKVVRSFNQNFSEAQNSYQSFLRIMQEVLGTVGNLLITEFQVSDQNFHDCMTGKWALPWRWWNQLAEIKAESARFAWKLIAKEGNRVAELLAEDVRDGGQNHPEIRKAIIEDRIGIGRWSPLVCF